MTVKRKSSIKKTSKSGSKRLVKKVVEPVIEVVSVKTTPTKISRKVSKKSRKVSKKSRKVSKKSRKVSRKSRKVSKKSRKVSRKSRKVSHKSMKMASVKKSPVKMNALKCDNINSKIICENEKDSKMLRKCRYNIKNNACEDMPEAFKERATYQVGGDATYKKYGSEDIEKIKKLRSQSALLNQIRSRGKK